MVCYKQKNLQIIKFVVIFVLVEVNFACTVKYFILPRYFKLKIKFFMVKMIKLNNLSLWTFFI